MDLTFVAISALKKKHRHFPLMGGGTGFYSLIGVTDTTYQTVTGSLTPGAHPGSYNGQDAYNDMLVTDDGISNGDRTSKRRNNVGGVTVFDK